MGEQFWWFYDVIAVAAVLVCVFISGRKGVFKSAISFIGYLMALVVAISLSSALAEPLYSNLIRNSNVTKLEKTISSKSFFLGGVSSHIESLGYNINVQTESLKKIYTSSAPYSFQIVYTDSEPYVYTYYDEELYKYVNRINNKTVDTKEAFVTKLHDGYASMIGKAVAEELSKYSAESAAKILREDPEKMDALIPLLMDNETVKPAAEYIVDKLTADAYVELFKLIGMIVMMILIVFITILLSKSLSDESMHDMRIAAHIAGGAVGILKGVIVVFAIAVGVRLYIVLGNNEMLFFNHAAIDNSKIFKYVYNFLVDKLV